MSNPLITYYIGAGASYGLVPMVSEFKNSFNSFSESLSGGYKNVLVGGTGGFGEKNKKLYADSTFEDFSNYVKKVNNEIRNNYSIDTLAKKRFLKGELGELEKLKMALSLFLHMVQFDKDSQDMLAVGADTPKTRYDLFFATILQKVEGGQFMLPKNMKIISWNYDFQFEKSYNEFLDFRETFDNKLNICPSTVLSTTEQDFSGFSIFKLNGTCGTELLRNEKFNEIFYSHLIEKDKYRVLDDLISRFKIFNEQEKTETGVPKEIRPVFHYSWENDDVPKRTRTLTIKSTKNTKVLVVIGYSFPTFNRNLDREILGNMKSLRKIYLQVPKDSFENVSQRIRGIRLKVEIIPVTALDEFYIPFEFQPEY